MEIVQWIVAAVTAALVALIGYLQWRTAQHKAVLDLFEKRNEVYEGVRKAVAQIVTSSQGFNQEKEVEFLGVMERAKFFFGDDMQEYLQQLWSDIVVVTSADRELPDINDTEQRRQIIERRRAAFDRTAKFYSEGQTLFARYMRFSQTVPW